MIGYRDRLSHKHKHASKQRSALLNGWTILLYVSLAIVGAAIVYQLLQGMPRHSRDHWPIADGIVLDARVKVSQILETEYGTRVRLQPELQISYTAKGLSEERWFALPERSDLTREQMDRNAANLIGTHIRVHWKKDNPLDAYLTEEPGNTTKP